MAAKIIGGGAMAAAAGVAAAATVAIPNPITAVATVHFTHLAVAAASLTGVGGAFEALGSGAKRSKTGLPEAVLGGEKMSLDEVTKALAPYKGSFTMKGRCSRCKEDASQTPGCLYLWTCCNQVSHVKKDPFKVDYSLGGGCQTECTNCDDDVRSVGCIRRCSNCNRTSKEEGFRKHGCSGLISEHDLESSTCMSTWA